METVAKRKFLYLLKINVRCEIVGTRDLGRNLLNIDLETPPDSVRVELSQSRDSQPSTSLYTEHLGLHFTQEHQGSLTETFQGNLHLILSEKLF